MLKRYVLSLLLMLCFTCHPKVKAETYDQTVSLGFACQVAYQLETHGYRTLASPFDWFHTPMDGLLAFISNKGARFLDLDTIHVIGPYPGHADRLAVVDVVYGIVSYHDFITEPWMGNYAHIKEKYDRRVKRFFELLDSNKKVLFIRQGSSRAEIESLDSLLHSLYPNLSYTIAAVNYTEEYGSNWELERIRNFLLPIHPAAWPGEVAKWTEVLAQFQIKPSKKPRAQEEVW